MTMNLLSCWKPLPLAFVEGLPRRRELSDKLVVNEELDDMFAQGHCCERPDGRSLPFDLEGGMVDGVLVHSGLTRIMIMI